MTITNRLVTRGMGVSHAGVGTAGMVTRGMGGGALEAIFEAGRRIVRAGRSAKEQFDRVVLYLKLIRVNGKNIDSKTLTASTIKENNIVVAAEKEVVVEQVNDVVIDVKLLD